MQIDTADQILVVSLELTIHDIAKDGNGVSQQAGEEAPTAPAAATSASIAAGVACATRVWTGTFNSHHGGHRYSRHKADAVHAGGDKGEAAGASGEETQRRRGQRAEGGREGCELAAAANIESGLDEQPRIAVDPYHDYKYQPLSLNYQLASLPPALCKTTNHPPMQLVSPRSETFSRRH